MKQSTFERSRAKWENETAALNDVCQTQNVSEATLTAEHTEEKFVWRTAMRVKYGKTEVTEKEAIDLAVLDLETFEGNLRPEHTEEYYVFSKVR